MAEEEKTNEEEAPTTTTTTEPAAEEEAMSFEIAEVLTKGGALDRAIEAWQALLEEAVRTHGEMHEETAKLYYKYGDALLRKAEESGELFAEERADDDDDDVVVAFEVLEVARIVAERDENDTFLATVLARLGDLQKLNGNYSDAVRDYQKALDLRSSATSKSDRRLADLHYCLAVTFEYVAATKETAESEKQSALSHYTQCAASLKARSLEDDVTPEEKAELEAILEELDETIQTATQPQEHLPFAKDDIGFKQPTNDKARPVNTLQPKRKLPPADDLTAKRPAHDETDDTVLLTANNSTAGAS